MSRLTRKLPTLTTLTTFECAARLASFKGAAAELGVTPGAISHQIRALEEDLGQKLFLRQHRGVELTPLGSVLFSTLENAFDDIATTVQSIREESAPASVNVGATSAVSTLWLSPAILRFWREHNDISVNQLVSDNRFSGITPPELYIRYGRDPRPGLDQHVLYRDTLVPVCSPSVAQQLGAITLNELANQRLVHMVADDVNWTSWHSWFQTLGHKGNIVSSMRVNNYTIALAAAEDGAGIVLGWRRLLGPLISKQTLVVLPEFSLDAPNRFHLVCQPESQLSDNARLLRNWLLKNL